MNPVKTYACEGRVGTDQCALPGGHAGMCLSIDLLNRSEILKSYGRARSLLKSSAMLLQQAAAWFEIEGDHAVVVEKLSKLSADVREFLEKTPGA
jgi:hypothetical protein